MCALCRAAKVKMDIITFLGILASKALALAPKALASTRHCAEGARHCAEGSSRPTSIMTKLTSGNAVNAWVGYITNVRNAVPRLCWRHRSRGRCGGARCYETLPAASGRVRDICLGQSTGGNQRTPGLYLESYLDVTRTSPLVFVCVRAR